MKPIKTNDLASLDEVLARRARTTVTENYNAKVRTNHQPAAPKREPIKVPLNALVERRKREENNQRIKKHAAVIKRQDPRLYVEALQNFGHDLEGLSVPKQVEFITALEKIRKGYRI